MPCVLLPRCFHSSWQRGLQLLMPLIAAALLFWQNSTFLTHPTRRFSPVLPQMGPLHSVAASASLLSPWPLPPSFLPCVGSLGKAHKEVCVSLLSPGGSASVSVVPLLCVTCGRASALCVRVSECGAQSAHQCVIC